MGLEYLNSRTFEFLFVNGINGDKGFLTHILQLGWILFEYFFQLIHKQYFGDHTGMFI